MPAWGERSGHNLESSRALDSRSFDTDFPAPTAGFRYTPLERLQNRDKNEI